MRLFCQVKVRVRYDRRAILLMSRLCRTVEKARPCEKDVIILSRLGFGVLVVLVKGLLMSSIFVGFVCFGVFAEEPPEDPLEEPCQDLSDKTPRTLMELPRNLPRNLP